MFTRCVSNLLGDGTYTKEERLSVKFAYRLLDGHKASQICSVIIP